MKQAGICFFSKKAPSYLLCPRQAQRVWIFTVSSEGCKWADCYELEVIKTTYWDNRPIQFLLYCSLFSNLRDLFFSVKFSIHWPMHKKRELQVACLCQQKRNVFVSMNDWQASVCRVHFCGAMYGQMGHTWKSPLRYFVPHGTRSRAEPVEFLVTCKCSGRGFIIPKIAIPSCLSYAQASK